MIFDSLTLHNFGIYRGEHEIVLTPSDHRPVVLFGALNGGGKTTLLDAFQLVLFGKLGKTSNRGKLGYQDYLLRCINRAVEPSLGASLSLKFRYRRAGNEDTYRVTRTWRQIGAAVKEVVDVERNGEPDANIAERWQEFVEELIPSQISDLFFFDGEKIESLADLDRSAELLKVGIHSLLGLDLVDHLTRSLTVIERRRKSEAHKEGPSKELTQAEADLDVSKTRSAEITAELGEWRNKLKPLQDDIAKLERQFSTEGGGLYEQRGELQSKLREASRRLDDVSDRLREFAAGDAPLLLLVPKIEEALELAQRESEARDAKALLRVLERRDSKITSLLKDEGATKTAIGKVEAFLSDSLRRYKAAADVTTRLNVEPETLAAYSAPRFAKIVAENRKLTDDYEVILEEVRVAEAATQAIPQEHAIASLIAKLAEKRSELTKLEARIAIGEEDFEKVYRAQQRLNDHIARLHEDYVTAELANDASQRVIRHSQKARETLVKFREEVARRSLARLEALITESFSTLLRKRTLVRSIRIDPETYALHIHDGHGDEVPASRLSAGERQILAVAILWSLARASGRVLPTVIDTPLGRLDSGHRNFLVKNYFPAASHQVILLSTDEEIYGSYYRSLVPFVAREYQIVHLEDERTSAIRPGYFEREDAA